MMKTPKSLRLHIGIFGRTNTGKSSFLNTIADQPASIVSSTEGTTTDVVYKSMELLPLGPVVFLDTAGIDDESSLGALRVEKTTMALSASDVALIILESDVWTPFEEKIIEACKDRKIPIIFVINKTDLKKPSKTWIEELEKKSSYIMESTSVTNERRTASEAAHLRETIILELKKNLIAVCPDDFLNPPAILGDLLPVGKGLPVVALIVPIDLQAPKGRLILPQVQSIRDALDSDAAVTVVKEREFPAYLSCLKNPPDLVVCDSQIVLKMTADTPSNVPCTTFSILFSRYKGNISYLAEGAAVLSLLKEGDRILISEACSHHPLADDIGRVKIPRWLRQFSGIHLEIDHYAGKDYPEDLSRYRLIIHCGGCTLTRREMLWRIEQARSAGVAMTNYGIAISTLQGVVERTLSPFPAALEAYRHAIENKTNSRVGA